MDKETKDNEIVYNNYSCPSCADRLKYLTVPFIGCMLIFKELALNSKEYRYKLSRMMNRKSILSGSQYALPILIFTFAY